MAPHPFVPGRAFKPSDGQQFSAHSDYHELAMDALAQRLPAAFLTREPFLTEFRRLNQAGQPYRVIVKGVRDHLPPSEAWPVLRTPCCYIDGDYDPVGVFCQTLSRTVYSMAKYDRQLACAGDLPYVRIAPCEDRSTAADHLRLADKVYLATDPGLRLMAEGRVWGCRCGTISMTRHQLVNESLRLADEPFDADAFANPKF